MSSHRQQYSQNDHIGNPQNASFSEIGKGVRQRVHSLSFGNDQHKAPCHIHSSQRCDHCRYFQFYDTERVKKPKCSSCQKTEQYGNSHRDPALHAQRTDQSAYSQQRAHRKIKPLCDQHKGHAYCDDQRIGCISSHIHQVIEGKKNRVFHLYQNRK